VPDERVTEVDQRLESHIGVGACRDIEDPGGIELEVLAFRDETGTGQLERVRVEHQVAFVEQSPAQLLTSRRTRRPNERLARGDGDLEVHRDHLDSITQNT